MIKHTASKISEVLKKHEDRILTDWMEYQLAAVAPRSNLIKPAELREQAEDKPLDVRSDIYSLGR